jgi:hypothetical protein
MDMTSPKVDEPLSAAAFDRLEPIDCSRISGGVHSGERKDSRALLHGSQARAHMAGPCLKMQRDAAPDEPDQIGVTGAVSTGLDLKPPVVSGVVACGGVWGDWLRGQDLNL